jgi:outer membrane immunogenic protein
MHKTVIGGLAALVLTAEVNAGDLPPYPGPCGGRPCPPMYPPPSPPPAPYDPYLYWCGPYIGANVGSQSGTVSNSGAKPSGVAAGFQGGYLWQFGQWVAGWESDFQFSSTEDSFAFFKFANPWWGTVRGRGGVAFDNLLLYGTAGLAYGRTRVDVASFSETNFHIGGTIGAGLEFGLSRNWSFKAEYLRVDLSSQHFTLTGADHGLASNVFRVGVNFRF